MAIFGKYWKGVKMEIDKTVIVVGVILLVVLGFFAISQMGGSGSTGNAVAGYAGQFAGGGCGR
jgi:hypothetical protein